MPELPSQESLREMASRWLSPSQVPKRFRIRGDTTDFFRVEYDDVVVLKGSPYLIRHNAKEQRFGLEDEDKHWVKRAIDLESGDLKIFKLVFYEKFLSHIGDIEFCASGAPEGGPNPGPGIRNRSFMQGHSVEDEKGNLIRVLDFIRAIRFPNTWDMTIDHEPYFYEPASRCLGPLHVIHPGHPISARAR